MIRLALVFALLFSVSSVVIAQDSTVPFCGQLSDSDCALLRDATASIGDLRSATFEYTLQAHSDVPEREQDYDQVYTVSGMVANLPGLDTPTAAMEVMRDADAAMTISIVISGLPSTLPDGSPPPVEIPAEMAVELRLVDGILYLNLDSVLPVPADPSLAGWVSFDLHAGIEASIQQIASSANTIGPIASGLDVELLVNTFDEDVLREFVRVTRNGNVFRTSVDFAAMYANAEYQSVLRSQLLERWEEQGRSGSITDVHLERLAGMMARVFPQPQVMRTVTVDPINRVISGYSAWSMWDFDTMIEAAIAGSDVTAWGLMTFEQSLALSDFNADITVVAPEDAQAISAEALSAIQVMQTLPLPISS